MTTKNQITEAQIESLKIAAFEFAAMRGCKVYSREYDSAIGTLAKMQGDFRDKFAACATDTFNSVVRAGLSTNPNDYLAAA